MKNNNKRFLVENVLNNTKNFDPDLQHTLKLISKEENKKPIIYIGAGTCGLGAGADKTKAAINQYLSHYDIDAELIEVGCIGLCSSEPIMDVKLPNKQRVSFEKVTAADVEEILDDIFVNKVNQKHVLAQFNSETQKKWDNVIDISEHPFFAQQERIVLENCGIIDPTSIDEYIAKGGYKAYLNIIKNYKREEVCNLIEESGLRGRGGGGFPTGKKWKFSLNTEADQKYFICNADEGDPGAFMDRAVIEGDPHKLIEGQAISAFAIGATKAYIYIRAEYPLAIERLEIALEKAREYGIIGKNIFGTG
ncbi:MAG: NADH-quinone oxidoreductase subunit F, partial [Bacteroidetes bacterium]